MILFQLLHILMDTGYSIFVHCYEKCGFGFEKCSYSHTSECASQLASRVFKVETFGVKATSYIYARRCCQV